MFHLFFFGNLFWVNNRLLTQNRLPNCRMRSIFMDSINRKRRKTYPRKNTQQIFPFWIICFELTIIGNSKQITKKEKMEHNILKSLQPLFNQGLECYDVHNYSLIHIPIPSNIILCLSNFVVNHSTESNKNIYWYPEFISYQQKVNDYN